MDGGEIATLVIVSNIVCGVFSARVAESKGLHQWGWFFGGLCFGVLALLAVGFCEKWTEDTKPKPGIYHENDDWQKYGGG